MPHIVSWEVAPGAAFQIYGLNYGEDWLYLHPRLGYLTSLPQQALEASQAHLMGHLMDSTIRVSAEERAKYGQWIYHDDEVGFLLTWPCRDEVELKQHLKQDQWKKEDQRKLKF